MNRVGFLGRSLYEMQALWQGIELFYLMDTSPNDLVDRAVCYLRVGPPVAAAIHTLFASRISRSAANEMVIDQRLCVGTREYPPSVLELTLSLSKQRPMEPADFDLIREVDAMLRALPVTPVPKPSTWPAFFQGNVLEQKLFVREMVKHHLIRPMSFGALE